MAKIRPKERQLRELREERAHVKTREERAKMKTQEQTRRLRAAKLKAKAVGNLVNLKMAKRGQ